MNQTTHSTRSLYTIFEQHLLDFQDPNSDRKMFFDKIIKDYFKHLRKNKILIPKTMEKHVVEELEHQLSLMLTKKIYGFFSIEEYQEKNRNLNPLLKKA